MNQKDNPNICLESEAFYQLIRAVVSRLRAENVDDNVRQWVGEVEAMSLLGITAKSTLQKFRDEGKIRFSKTTPKNILYYRKSIMDYISKNARDTF